jgi:hypothetical protein
MLFLFTQFKSFYGKNTHIALFCTYQLVIYNLEKVGCEIYTVEPL